MLFTKPLHIQLSAQFPEASSEPQNGKVIILPESLQ